ncbi:MAG: hypothetical protein Q8Q05_01200 [bacterium]|nr:hypothetical protein [bacterium]
MRPVFVKVWFAVFMVGTELSNALQDYYDGIFSQQSVISVITAIALSGFAWVWFDAAREGKPKHWILALLFFVAVVLARIFTSP